MRLTMGRATGLRRILTGWADDDMKDGMGTFLDYLLTFALFA